MVSVPHLVGIRLLATTVSDPCRQRCEGRYGRRIMLSVRSGRIGNVNLLVRRLMLIVGAGSLHDDGRLVAASVVVVVSVGGAAVAAVYLPSLAV